MCTEDVNKINLLEEDEEKENDIDGVLCMQFWKSFYQMLEGVLDLMSFSVTMVS